MTTLREKITEAATQGEFTVLFMDGFDDAIVGLVTRFGMETPVVLYDRAKMVKVLTARDGMSEDDADEFISFNCEGAWVGEQTPAFLLTVEP